MAILHSNPFGWIICHETFFDGVYKRTRIGDGHASHRLNPVLFDIFEPFKDRARKRVESESEIELIKKALESLRESFDGYKTQNGNDSNRNSAAKLTADNFYNGSFDYPRNSFLGGNAGEEPLLTAVENEKYLFPKKCSFYSYDIKEINDHLRDKSYHFILMDPPWWNKFIRRKRKANAHSGYTMLYDSDLMNIPVDYLLKDDGIIGIWCTSAQSHINAILNLLFPAWNIEFVAQWFWLKVTKTGEPVCAFSQFPGKQPYERIIFGKKRNAKRRYSDPGNNKVLVSVPSAIHSHKPPVCEVLKPCLPEEADCLEIFARYLLPHWTSYGNEVLKLQHISLYTEAEDGDADS